MKKTTKELVTEITDYLNSFDRKEEEFCKTMSCEHRTLQQNFTRLCLSWIEHCASDEYRTDLRNEGSKEMAKELLSLFREKKIKQGFTSYTLDLMSKPSGYLRYI